LEPQIILLFNKIKDPSWLPSISWYNIILFFKIV
jgi:hypothetical protein